MFQKAQRRSAKLRLALMGPSGSGKTYSALQVAKGIGGRIAMIDTERGSGSLYSDLAEYDVAELAPPFNPQQYVDAIKAAEEAGYDILIIDSLSHAWAGPGGILDIHDRVTKSVRNSFAAWREVTPVHNSLVDAMIASSCHVIVTLRTKTAYEVVNDGGKTKVQKVGVQPVQREGLEYEFTVVFDLSIEGHVANATKDRTGLFDGQFFTPDEGTGRKLLSWLNSGPSTVTGTQADLEGQAGVAEDQGASQPVPLSQQIPFESRSEKSGGFLVEHLHRMLEQLGLMDSLDLYYQYVCNRYNASDFDALTSKQLTEQLTMLRQCKEKKEKLKQFLDVLQQLKLAA